MKYANWYHANVVRVVRAYPWLKAQKDAKQAQSVTANYSGEPRAPGPSRSAENAALRQLAPAEEEALQAVESALERVSMWRDGDRYVDLFRAYYFRREGRFLDCAERRFLPEWTARRRNADFLRFVAEGLRLR